MIFRDEEMQNLLTHEVSEQIGDGQIGEVHVGGRLHVLVPEDDEARGDVAEHAEHEDDGVHDRDGDDGGERQVRRAELALDVGRERSGVAEEEAGGEVSVTDCTDY